MKERLKLSFSNIAWTAEQDEEIYELLERNLFDAVEIAPTRIYPEYPYSHVEGIREYAWRLKESHGLTISSLQSIWYGKKENLFVNVAQQDALLDYTRRAADFAFACGAGNLVFGCPANRNVPSCTNRAETDKDADSSNTQRAAYSVAAAPSLAMTHDEKALEERFYHFINRMFDGSDAYFALEAVSPMYHTNYLNTTKSAIEKAEALRDRGYEKIRVNLDIGTMIAEGSGVEILKGKIPLISHVHISEPGLKPIEEREIHQEIMQLLKEEGYNRYVSVEMGKGCSVQELNRIMRYVLRIAV